MIIEETLHSSLFTLHSPEDTVVVAGVPRHDIPYQKAVLSGLVLFWLQHFTHFRQHRNSLVTSYELDPTVKILLPKNQTVVTDLALE